MPVRIVSTRDQQPITVNAMVANPLIIPERILAEFQNQFVSDQLLRNAGKATGGAVQYRVSSGLFADTGAEIVAEGGEIPLATVTKGDINTAQTQKRALGVAITQEMRDRDAVGEVERQIQVVKNTVVRDVDGAFITALTGAVTQTRAATATWATAGTATIRKDINAAKLLIKKATAPGASANSYMAFQPDTLLIGVDSEADLLNSNEFTQLIFGSANPSNIASLNDLPDANVLGLRPLVSIALPAGTAYVLQSKVVGGYADERPLQATELYEERKNELWRSDCLRTTAGFIDQPLAAAKITGT
jgi:hypothetical protein